MAKIVLGSRPPSFKKKITVALPEGVDGEITVTYKYRTRSEFGAFVDEVFKTAAITPKDNSDNEIKFSLAEALAKTTEVNADYLMKIMDGWDLSSDFTRDNVAQLCDELPGVALAIIDNYRQAISEGRLGN
jgi:hypothetical protein